MPPFEGALTSFEEYLLERELILYNGDASRRGDCPRSGSRAPDHVPKAGAEKTGPGWRRTHKDPFAGECEQILSWPVVNPERSSGDIFRERQRRSPGRYQPLQIRTLQRGMRKIRAYLLELIEEQWQAEVTHGSSSPPVSSAEHSAAMSIGPAVG